ncbi:MAG: hypothetical protein ACE5E0_05125 [Terriglobia bacterium]
MSEAAANKRDHRLRGAVTVCAILLLPVLLGLNGPTVRTNAPNGESGLVVIEGRVTEAAEPLIAENGQPLKKLLGARTSSDRLKIARDKEGRHYRLELPFEIGRQQYEIEESIFYVNYHFRKELDLRYASFLPKKTAIAAKAVLEPLAIHYEVNLPGRVVHTNTDQVFGGQSIWTLEFGRKEVLEAESQTVRWRLVILTGLAVVIITGIVGVQIIRRLQG